MGAVVVIPSADVLTDLPFLFFHFSLSLLSVLSCSDPVQIVAFLHCLPFVCGNSITNANDNTGEGTTVYVCVLVYMYFICLCDRLHNGGNLPPCRTGTGVTMCSHFTYAAGIL